MHYYFTEEDYKALNEEITRVCDRIKDAGKEMGISCKEGAETFHDNFAYEEGERQQFMWSKRLRELIKIRNQARVVRPEGLTDTVSFGRTVTVECLETGKEKTFKIGSYMTFGKKETPGEDSQTVSYSAPLARLVINAKIGDVREGNFGGKNHSYKVVKIN